MLRNLMNLRTEKAYNDGKCDVGKMSQGLVTLRRLDHISSGNKVGNINTSDDATGVHIGQSLI